jgi:hypothetical protein
MGNTRGLSESQLQPPPPFAKVTFFCGGRWSVERFSWEWRPQRLFIPRSEAENSGHERIDLLCYQEQFKLICESLNTHSCTQECVCEELMRDPCLKHNSSSRGSALPDPPVCFSKAAEKAHCTIEDYQGLNRATTESNSVPSRTELVPLRLVLLRQPSRRELSLLVR